MRPARGIASVIIVLIVLGSVVLGTGSLFAYQKYFQKQQKEEPTSKIEVQSSPSPTTKTTQSAINAYSNECKEFESAAAVPTDWFKISGCSKEFKDWVTYKNNDLKFEFKHPPYFLGEEAGGFGSGLDTQPIKVLIDPYTRLEGTDRPFNGIQVFVMDNKNASLDQFITEEKSRLLETWRSSFYWVEGSKLDQETKIIGGKNSIALKGMFGRFNNYYIPLSSSKVLVLAQSEKEQDAFKTQFDQILSTFKFE